MSFLLPSGLGLGTREVEPLRTIMPSQPVSGPEVLWFFFSLLRSHTAGGISLTYQGSIMSGQLGAAKGNWEFSISFLVLASTVVDVARIIGL